MVQNYDKIKGVINSYRVLMNKYSDIIDSIISFEFFEVTPDEGFIRGGILFIDGSKLRFFEYIVVSATGIVKKLKYRYHYEDPNGELIFRYDNAPHHRQLKTYPHHKHVRDKVVESHEPVWKKF